MSDVLASLWMLSGAVRAQTWNIGVLAMRGEVSTRNHWQPLETLLNQQIPVSSFIFNRWICTDAGGGESWNGAVCGH
jgi:hypothetical protein